MMEWFNNYSPGFMCVGGNPHPFGNERRIIFCGLTSILWRAQIVEGKYCPPHRGAKQHQELGKTVDIVFKL